MSDNLNIETEFKPDAAGNLQPQSEEDKFFGVKTEITKETTNTDNLEVEVVDDTPAEDRRPPKVETEDTAPVDDDTVDAEITDYSKRAGDRINKLKYEYHEERRAKESAQKQAEEATKRLKTLLTDNQRLQQLVSQGSEVLNEQAVANAQFAKQSATEKFKKAYDDGDAEAMAAAQAELAKASVAETSAPQYAQALQQNAVMQQPQPEIPEVDSATKDWVAKNSWFMGDTPQHQEMTAYALYKDKQLQAGGVDPASPRYYEEIDNSMRKEFPDFYGVQPQDNVQVETPEEKPQPSNVVAPVTRTTGNQNSRSVRLTQTQVKLARQLGITPEQYAKQLLQES